MPDIPTAVWIAVTNFVSGCGSFFIAVWTLRASVRRNHDKIAVAVLAGENAERAKFREILMTDIANLRQMIKDCERDRDAIRSRLYTAEKQIVVLKASAEIMERWLAYFKTRHLMPGAPALSPDGSPA